MKQTFAAKEVFIHQRDSLDVVDASQVGLMRSSLQSSILFHEAMSTKLVAPADPSVAAIG